MADEDPGFSYNRWESSQSTTNIFYHDDNGVPRSLAWHPTRIPDPIFLDDPHTLCSSCRGFTISRVAWSDYYIGNPFAADSDVHEDDGEPRHEGPIGNPTSHPPHHTHTVLASYQTDPIDEDDVELTMFHVIRALWHWPFIYTFDEFSPLTQRWVTGPAKFNLRREIVPNTGTSCGRFAFWLTEYPSSVLRYDVWGYNDEIISFLELPRPILDSPAREARMQLGRVGDMLGLIIVDAAECTVELYTRGLDEDQCRPPQVFDVEIKVAAATVCRLEEKTWTLFCREMPRPMRFESFKMEALFWVAGRVVMLESNANNEDEFRVRVLPGEAPASIVDGLPHVCTNLIPSGLYWP